jgi:hypothetical protein
VAGEPYFRYYKLAANGALLEIPPGSLPMRHLNGWHGSPADTGNSARVDSIRLVRARFTAVHRDPRYPDVTRVEERTVRLTNAGLILASTCGDAPLPGGAVMATAAATPSVTLTWARSLDEGAGEKDVERYAIYRRPAADPVFGEPLASIAAGSPTYSFTDTDVIPGQSWVYGVAAQDCNPLLSPLVTSAAVLIP